VEVEAQITTLLIGQKATKLAQDTVSDLLVKFKAGTEIANELLAIGATFESKAAVGRYTSDVAQNIIRAAFVLPHPFDGVLSASSVSLSNGDLALIEVKAVQLSDNSNATPELSKQQTSQLAQAAYSSYVDSLKVDESPSIP
jgi:peptidyl-prolyl cis-trans isomerase D